MTTLHLQALANDCHYCQTRFSSWNTKGHWVSRSGIESFKLFGTAGALTRKAQCTRYNFAKCKPQLECTITRKIPIGAVLIELAALLIDSAFLRKCTHIPHIARLAFLSAWIHVVLFFCYTKCTLFMPQQEEKGSFKKKEAEDKLKESKERHDRQIL